MAPTELENIILTHPDVADVGVVGVPDLVAGELPMAWVVKKPDAKVTEKDIADFVAGKSLVRIDLAACGSGSLIPKSNVTQNDTVDFILLRFVINISAK